MTNSVTRSVWLLRTRYAVAGVGIAAALALLQETHALSVVNDAVEHFLDLAARFGAPGMFVAGLVGNASVLVQVPYTLPLLSVALEGATLGHLLVLGLACGIGAGVGEIISYLIADAILARTPELPESRVYRWIERNTDHHPVLTKLAIFVWAVTPLPDDTVIVPLAMVSYGVRRIALPLFTGKVVHNLVIAYVFYRFAVDPPVSPQVKTDLALVVIVAFVLVVLYQVERARLAARRPKCASESASCA
jgi:membrane protein YqaA with SNARE-associated domain